MTFPAWLHKSWTHIAELVQDEHLWLKYVFLFYLYFFGPIILLDKTLIPRLGSCGALWSCTETAIWTFNPLVPIEVHYMEKKEKKIPQIP